MTIRPDLSPQDKAIAFLTFVVIALAIVFSLGGCSPVKPPEALPMESAKPELDGIKANNQRIIELMQPWLR